MRLLELHVENTRGIKQLSIKPMGENLVIWGPNGSGKSAVVDAIDFLLTGRISRLSGRGTKGITLKKHGPHIDSSPQDAKVSALVKISGLEETVEISRSFNEPSTINCPKEALEDISNVLTIAGRGQHVLSRREILKFITSESGSRADEIQTILDLSDIESIRKALVKLRGEVDREVQSTQRVVAETIGAILSTTQLDQFTRADTLDYVNSHREVLGGKPISKLTSTDLKTAISLPKAMDSEPSINVTLIKRQFENVLNLLTSDKETELYKSDESLRTTLESLESDPKSLERIRKRALLKQGLSLLPETGKCPLCDSQFPPGELKAHIEDELRKSDDAKLIQSEITKHSSNIINSVDVLIPSLSTIRSTFSTAKMSDAEDMINSWKAQLDDLLVLLSAPIGKYLSAKFTSKKVSQLLAPKGISKELINWSKVLEEKYPESSPELVAFETLTSLEENLKAYEKATKDLGDATSLQGFAQAIHDSFISARDEILNSLYQELSERLTSLYKELHGEDEESFSAAMTPDGAALDLAVDFYGRGTYPPHALHSEGHQDSMGICLFLALSERLMEGIIDLTLLDDVVMSVDSGHRRGMCKLLGSTFPDKQFIITTHDKTWANQLRAEGIIGAQGFIEFYKWDIDSGPYVNLEGDLWAKIDSFLDSNDITNAAALLRRGSEQFFSYVCHSLEAKVRYVLDGSNNLGDLLPTAMGKFRSLIKLSKTVAESWAKTEEMDELVNFESTVVQVYERTRAEQWAVNPAIHFNSWANLCREDFNPVRDAFQDLFGLFVCQECGSVIGLTKKEMTPVSVRCNCGKIDWNLIKKKSV